MPTVHSTGPRHSPILIKFGRMNILGPNMKKPKFGDDWFIRAPRRKKTFF